MADKTPKDDNRRFKFGKAVPDLTPEPATQPTYAGDPSRQALPTTAEEWEAWHRAAEREQHILQTLYDRRCRPDNMLTTRINSATVQELKALSLATNRPQAALIEEALVALIFDKLAELKAKDDAGNALAHYEFILSEVRQEMKDASK